MVVIRVASFIKLTSSARFDIKRVSFSSSHELPFPASKLENDEVVGGVILSLITLAHLP
jgi:hypothetical protein